MTEVSLNPEELKAYKNAIAEITNSMTRIDAENELIKDICEVQKEKYGIKPTFTKKVAQIIFKDSLDEEVEKMELISTLVEKLSS